MDVSTWLRDLGLENYVQAFQAHDIDAEVLPRLTAEDLIGLGITSIGHRRKLLEAISALDSGKVRSAAEPLAAAMRPLEAERRQLTVLFCDLVGSTELSGRLDPEDLREVMRAYQVACADVVCRFEGHVARFLGDGVLAYFGWPRAHEEDAERAVHAGLQLVQEIARLKPRAEVRLQARVGIATGHVVVGDLISEGISDKEAVIGDTPNLAARLQAVAAPASVVISPSTRRLVGGLFDLDDLGSQRLKGFAEPLVVWRVDGQRRAEGRFEARQIMGLTPLVGRGEELSLLLRRWRQAQVGDGQVVLLSGEPGIGKSRLVRELGSRLEGEPHLRLTYQCSSHHQTSPLHPVIEQLERAAGFEREHPPETRLDKLEALLARGRCARPVISGSSASNCTDKLGQVVSLVAALLGVPTGDRYPLPELTPQRQKQLTLEALVDQLEGFAAGQPVLLIYEDAHWTDPTTQELLALTIERMQRLPMLLLITFRPEFVPPWTGLPQVSVLPLTRLSHRDGAAMVDRVVGAKALPTEVSAQIVAKTDGVPLFVEELTKAVLESGILRDAGDRWEFTGPLPPLAIPSTLHDSLLARLDRLAPVKEIAQIGAAIGREFSYALLAAVADRPEPDLQAALDQLVSSELVFRRGVPPDATYSFKHVLVQDAAYGTLLRARRQQLHARIAHVLEDQFPDEARSHPEQLAHHCAQAGLFERAVHYWYESGQRAAVASAHREAIGHLRQGLSLLTALPGGADRLRQELRPQSSLGPALLATMGYAAPEVEEAYCRATDLCQELNRTDDLFAAMRGLFLVYLVRGDLESALKMANEIVELAQSQESVIPLVMGYYSLGMALFYHGDLLTSLGHLEHGVWLYENAQASCPVPLYGIDLGVTCPPIYPARVLWHLGYPDQAASTIQNGLQLAREITHAYSLVHALDWAAAVHQHRGEFSAAQEQAESVISLATEHGFKYLESRALVFRGAALASQGYFDEGIAQMREGMKRHVAMRTKHLVTCFSSLLAEAYVNTKQIEAGLSTVTETLHLVEKTRERFYEAELYRLKGELHLGEARPDYRQADVCFRRALQIARGQQAKSWELRAASSLARLWRDQGKRAEAYDLLAPIYGWFTEGFDTADLTQAKALLDELG